jgi:hypothetical protein
MKTSMTAIVFARVTGQSGRTFSASIGGSDVTLDVGDIRFLCHDRDRVDFSLARDVQFAENHPYPRLIGACDGYAALQLEPRGVPIVLPLPQAIERIEAAGIKIFPDGAEDE